MGRLLLLAGGLLIGLAALLAIRSGISDVDPGEETAPPPSEVPSNRDGRLAPPPASDAEPGHRGPDLAPAEIRVTVDRADHVPGWSAKVSLRPCGEADGEPSSAIEEREADEDGRCVFERLEPGDYVVYAELEGWAPDSRSVMGLGPAETREVELRLAYGRSITGRVYDEGGAPIANARVSAGPAAIQVWARGRSTAFSSFAFPPRRSASTDIDGGYTIDSLPEGLFDVQASAEDHLPATVHDIRTSAEGVDLTLFRSYGLVVRLTWEGEQRPEDVVVELPGGRRFTRIDRAPGAMRYGIKGLLPGRHRIDAHAAGFASAWARAEVTEAEKPSEVEMRLVPGTEVSGVVTDLITKEPISWAEVVFTATGGEETGGAAPVVRASTDESGLYRARVGPGLWEVRATKGGYRPAVPFPAAARDPPHVPLRVGEEPVACDLVLVREYSVVGRVLWDDGEPAERGAFVRAEDRKLLPGVESPEPDRVVWTKMNEGGGFRLTGLLPIYTYTIRARCGDFSTDAVEDVRFRGNETEVRVRDLVLVRPPIPPPGETAPPSLVQARVVDPRGNPVPGAIVTALGSKAVTDLGGAFEIRCFVGRNGANVRLWILAPGLQPATLGLGRCFPGEDLDAGRIVLPESGIRVSGRVVCGKDRPVPWAEVDATFPFGYQVRTVADRSGFFQLTGPGMVTSDPMQVLVHAWAPGYARRGITRTARGDLEVDIRLDPLSLVKGRIDFPKERPPWVDLIVSRKPTSRHLRLEQDGSFLLEMEPGVQLDRFEAPGHLPTELGKPTTVPGEVLDLGKVRLRVGGTLVVRVTDRADRNTPGAVVWITYVRQRGEKFRAPSIPRAQTDERGEARFPNLYPGEYRIAVSPDWRPVWKSVKIVEEETHTEVIVLK